MDNQLVIIGHTFPEPTTTAAGGRMMQLIELFIEEGYKITFASTAIASERSADLEEMRIAIASIALNDPSFDAFILKLKPSIVLFDRYITEEQFGWRVAEQCPDALRILDTEDLHFLRKARQEAVKAGLLASEANVFTDTAKRELASIFRCDLSLIISEVELEILQNTFRVPKEILHYIPFLVASISEVQKEKLPNFDARDHFITIGNFQHAPNADSVVYLKKEIWPGIRKQLPKAQLHVYGAYAPKFISEMHNEREGFLIKGWVPEVGVVMQKARVCLAPLRFGAGLKGKILDAMNHGTPCVTTPVGAEGMHGTLPFPGAIEEEVTTLAKASVQLYSEEQRWREAQQNGFQIIENRFQKSTFSEAFKEAINQMHHNLIAHRNLNFTGQIIQHQTLQSTKYLSKWIETKKSQQ